MSRRSSASHSSGRSPVPATTIGSDARGAVELERRAGRVLPRRRSTGLTRRFGSGFGTACRDVLGVSFARTAYPSTWRSALWACHAEPFGEPLAPRADGAGVEPVDADPAEAVFALFCTWLHGDPRRRELQPVSERLGWCSLRRCAARGTRRRARRSVSGDGADVSPRMRFRSTSSNQERPSLALRSPTVGVRVPSRRATGSCSPARCCRQLPALLSRHRNSFLATARVRRLSRRPPGDHSRNVVGTFIRGSITDDRAARSSSGRAQSRPRALPATPRSLTHGTAARSTPAGCRRYLSAPPAACSTASVDSPRYSASSRVVRSRPFMPAIRLLERCARPGS